MVLKKDLPVGNYNIEIEYTDSSEDNATVKQLTNIVATDLCLTDGLKNLPQDNQHDINYIIESPSTTIPFEGISNGECRYFIYLHIDTIDSTTPDSAIGLVNS